MCAWGKSPPEWYALPRPDRAYMAAYTRAHNLVQLMYQWDDAKDREQEAERKANLKRHNRR